MTFFYIQSERGSTEVTFAFFCYVEYISDWSKQPYKSQAAKQFI